MTAALASNFLVLVYLAGVSSATSPGVSPVSSQSPPSGAPSGPATSALVLNSDPFDVRAPRSSDEALLLRDPAGPTRFQALDLSRPALSQGLPAYLTNAELSNALTWRTDPGLEFSMSPQERLALDEAGVLDVRTGAEFRVGQSLYDRDQRGTNAAAPSWYLFVGADNEALVWNFIDRHALGGLTLRDQAMVGDLRVGMAWSVGDQGELSFGLVERKIEFNAPAADKGLQRKDRLAALSLVIHR